jgi:hypothetical protein
MSDEMKSGGMDRRFQPGRSFFHPPLAKWLPYVTSARGDMT